MITTLLTFAAPSFAYDVWDFPWNATTFDMKLIDNDPFPNNTTDSDLFDDAADLWWFNPSSHYLTVSGDNEAGIGTPNGESELYWTTNMGDLCGSDACTHWWVGTDGFDIFLNEADIYFNSAQNWTTGSTKSASWSYGGPSRPLMCTALHEMGHALGLDHEPDVYNIMGTDWTVVNTNGNTARCEIGSDAMNGMASAYGRTYHGKNLSLSHFRRSGSSGGYSTHTRVRMFTSGGALLTNLNAGNAEPNYQMPGNTVKVELTMESVGQFVGEVNQLQFFLSTNSTISTADTLIGTTFVPMTSSVGTWTFTLTLPGTFSPGQTFFVGAIVDPTNTLSEYHENDNAVYISQITF